MTAPKLDRSNIVAFIADIFERRGAESYLGEQVSMSEHMLQELVAAALLHDIGHYTSEFGPMSLGDAQDNYHEESGAKVLAPFFPPVITECVRLHVPAKRYLCATDKGYYDRLSEASKHTLMLQGGPMSAEEVAEFETNPFHRQAVRVRIWDDEGKKPGVVTPEFRHYMPLLQRVVERQDRAA
jgi:predicted HD phosphohydrolase